MYSYVEQTLIQATDDMEIEEEVLTGLTIFSFDTKFDESLYFEVSCKTHIFKSKLNFFHSLSRKNLFSDDYPLINPNLREKF